jgi:hypothetical protein
MTLQIFELFCTIYWIQQQQHQYPLVIVHSTWTNEKQWQHEECCPSSSYSSLASDKHLDRRASLKKSRTLNFFLIRLFL